MILLPAIVNRRNTGAIGPGLTPFYCATTYCAAYKENTLRRNSRRCVSLDVSLEPAQYRRNAAQWRNTLSMWLFSCQGSAAHEC